MTEVSIGAVPGGSADLRGYLAVRPAPGRGRPWSRSTRCSASTTSSAATATGSPPPGYLTLGLNLFSDGGPRHCIVTTMRAMFRGKGKPIADIDAGRRYLVDSADSTDKVGIIGFCMGGGFALLTAPRGFDVAAANYGQAPAHASEVFRDACPVVASYGGRDPLMIGQARRVEKGADGGRRDPRSQGLSRCRPLVPQRRDGRAARAAADRAGAQRRAPSRGREGRLGTHREVLRHLPALAAVSARGGTPRSRWSGCVPCRRCRSRSCAPSRGSRRSARGRPACCDGVRRCRVRACGGRWRRRRSTSRAASRRSRR